MSASLAYDAKYYRSISGILKIGCLICCIIGFLCIILSSVQLRNLRGTFYITVAILGFCCTSMALFARLFQLWQRKFYHFNVNRFEMYLHGFLAFAFFMASAVAVSLDVLTYSIATFFGFTAFCLYAYDAYLGYRLCRQTDATTQTQNI